MRRIKGNACFLSTASGGFKDASEDVGSVYLFKKVCVLLLTLAPGAHSLYQMPCLPSCSPRFRPYFLYPACETPESHCRCQLCQAQSQKLLSMQSICCLMLCHPTAKLAKRWKSGGDTARQSLLRPQVLAESGTLTEVFNPSFVGVYGSSDSLVDIPAILHMDNPGLNPFETFKFDLV